MNWNKTKEEHVLIEKGNRQLFSRGRFNVKCIRGTLWITWPGSGDVILLAGEEISFKSEGILCMTALSGALANIRISMLTPRVRDIPRVIIGKSLKGVLSYLKDGEGKSVLGDSIHSITR